MTYYEELEVLPTASPEVIRMAYKALAKKYHPDIYEGDTVFAEEKMKRINEAYCVLSSPVLRQEYDRMLQQMGGVPNPSSQSHQSSSTQRSGSSQKSAATQQSGSTRKSSSTQQSSSEHKSSSTQQPFQAQRSGQKTQNAPTQQLNHNHIKKQYVIVCTAFAILLGVCLLCLEDKIFIFFGFFCIGECFFCYYSMRTDQRVYGKVFATLGFVTFIFLLIMCFWGIMYSNNLLWYGQHEQNSHIAMNINANEVEKTSFLYLIKQLDSETNVDDVIAIMGADYEVPDNNGYEMKYATSMFTLDGNSSTFISFKFNARKTQILSIKWALYAPSQSQFKHTLAYLQENALGNPISFSNNMADWTGIHLEDTGYYLLLIREY